MALPSEVDSEALIGRADAALYRAKDQGRNCVRLSLETAVALRLNPVQRRRRIWPGSPSA